ncbi:hypothetical protein WKW77_17340 [Variovorax ureilyticus]|uniref:Uncharacterized protein n=1 Tax=Variovorax ureilyticus TaxID=1836198 RepID=A0ABU8VI64_9BURK
MHTALILSLSFIPIALVCGGIALGAYIASMHSDRAEEQREHAREIGGSRSHVQRELSRKRRF